jgi:hypothetical protein
VPSASYEVYFEVQEKGRTERKFKKFKFGFLWGLTNKLRVRHWYTAVI